MVHPNFKQFKFHLSEKYSKLVIYNLSSEETFNNIIQDLQTSEINLYTVLYASTNELIFRDSCHICQINYKEIYSYEKCAILKVANSDVEQIKEAINRINEEIIVKLICQVKLDKNLICPLLIEQQNEKGKLVEIVEKWFSDEEIVKHKDILVSMNVNGWVPLSVIETKLEDVMIIKTSEIAEKLHNSAILQVDESAKFVRRTHLQLPDCKEQRQVVLVDIPDNVKSTRLMLAFLQTEGAFVDLFDYGTHSAIVSLATRRDACQLVSDVLDSQRMKARLLVPHLVEDGGAVDQLSGDLGDLEKALASMAVKPAHQTSSTEVHVMRMSPSDLSYRFRDGFVTPDQATVERLVTQCNFYFGDANVLKDLFLLNKIKSSPGGWIQLEIVGRFKQMVKLSRGDLDTVVYALCFSDQVQISRDGRQLRRRLPLPEWDSSIYIRSLFLWNMPRVVDSYEKLDQVFYDEGRFTVRVSRFIRAEQNVPADLRKLCDKIPVLGKVNCGVVEFSSREAMLMADDFIHMKWASVKTFYLDTKEELPKPAVIVGCKSSSKSLPPPIPVSSFIDDRVAPQQAGTRIDPRFWQVARLLSLKKRTEMRVYNTDISPFSDAAAFVPVQKDAFVIANKKDFPELSATKKKLPKGRQPFRPISNKKPKGTKTKGPKKQPAKVGQEVPTNEENKTPVAVTAQE